MTYRAPHIPPHAPAPILRRPVEATPRPRAARAVAQAERGTLPGFLRTSLERESYWTESEGPVRIAGFDPREHVLSLEFDAGAPLPQLTVATDEDRAVSALMANGKPVAVLFLDDTGFTLDNVAVTQTPS